MTEGSSPTKQNQVRLSDVIRIALPFSTRVVAPPNRSQQAIEWVALLTSVGELDSQVSSGDLVILPESLHSSLNAKRLSDLILSLAKLQAAGLVLFKDVADSADKHAQKLELPLLITDGSMSVRDVHRDISSLLIDRRNQISERGMQLYRELSEMSREGEGLQKMAKLIGQLTGKIVVVQDKRLEVVALEQPAGSLPLNEESLIETLQDQDNLPAVLRNRKAAAKATKSHWQQLLFPLHQGAQLISPIISGDRARGYLSIIGSADELDLLDNVAVEQGAAACALEMAKSKAVSEAKKALRGNFLEGILAGNIPAKEIERLSARLDHETDKPHAVMAFRWADDNADVSLRRIETTLNWLLSTNNRPTLVHIYGEHHVCVFQAQRKEDGVREAQKLARRLREQLQSDFPKAILIGGLSGPVDELLDWRDAHQQALQALAVGERLKLNEIVEYGSLGVYRLLSQLDDVPAVHAFCDHVIGPLVNYDRQHSSQLVHTIEQYFTHHGNVSQTAEALFIHRNTLLYRLERIQDLTGHDLNMSDMRLALHLALKLWQLRPDN